MRIAGVPDCHHTGFHKTILIVGSASPGGGRGTYIFSQRSLGRHLFV